MLKEPSRTKLQAVIRQYAQLRLDLSRRRPRPGDLEEALKKMSQRRTAVEVFKLVERYAPPDARIGATNIYTAP